MSRHSTAGQLVLRLFLIALLAAAVAATAACQGESGAGGSSKPAPEKRSAAPEPEPEYSSWVVHINDDDSFDQGGITYSIALNLTATNPSGDMAGTYSGKAVAKTGTNGAVGGGQLDADAIAHSGTLEFTLAEGLPDDSPLAPLTEDTKVYSGTGTITMKAAGTARLNGAAGGFSNTSGQQVSVQVTGSDVLLQVPIGGHTYSFNGTIGGK